jgi:RHS repeat-associated protein
MYIRGPHNRVVAQETWTESGSSVTTSPILYHHDDIIGSTVVTNTGATSSSATRLRYDPYGLRISPTNPTQAPTVPPSGLPTRIGYTGHEMDDEFNLINMKGRIYDPKIARFMTPDPMVSAPNNGNGYDRYGYGGNNPMKYTDPSGFIYCLSDIWLMQQGYDIDFVNFMRTFAAWRKTKEDREWDAREAAKAGYAAAQTAQVRDNKGRVVGTVTILEYDRQDGKKGINILVGFKGNGTVQFDALNFIQTIITNSPLGNNPANAPYNDHQPGDKGPFYYTAEGLAAYSNNGGFDIRFFDDPWRRDSAGQFYWQGELSLIGLTDGSYQILETFGYGFSFGASGGLTLLPIRIVTPSPYQRGSVPRD